jgi:hypothetical protein
VISPQTSERLTPSWKSKRQRKVSVSRVEFCSGINALTHMLGFLVNLATAAAHPTRETLSGEKLSQRPISAVRLAVSTTHVYRLDAHHGARQVEKGSGFQIEIKLKRRKPTASAVIAARMPIGAFMDPARIYQLIGYSHGYYCPRAAAVSRNRRAPRLSDGLQHKNRLNGGFCVPRCPGDATRLLFRVMS